jgi:hypothetical protein
MRTYTLRPTGDKSVNAFWVPTPPGAAFSTIDEVVEDAADYLRVSTANTNIAATFTFSPTTQQKKGTIVSVQVSVRAMGNTLRLQPRVVTTDWSAAYWTLTASDATYDSAVLTINPATGVAWTWADIESNGLGWISLDSTAGGTGITVYQSWITVIAIPPYAEFLITTPSGGGYVAMACIIASDASTLAKAQFQIDDATDFATPLADTGLIDATEVAGASKLMLLAWVPSAAATYYARFGAQAADESTVTWTAAFSFVVVFPSITSITKAQSRDTLVWTIVIADAYKQPPLVSIIVDDCAYPAKLIAFSAGSYTYVATASLERGKHQWKAAATNLWQTVNTDYAPFYADYALDIPGISIYAGDSKIQAWGIVLSDALLPEYPVLSFISDAWLFGDHILTAKCYLRGIKRYTFTRRYVNKNADGTWTYQCESTDKGQLEDVTTIMVSAVGIAAVLAQAIRPLRLADDYSVLIPGFIYQTVWNLAAKAGIVSQLLVQAGVNAWCRSGTMFCHKQDVSAEIPRMAVCMDDVMATYNEDARTYNWVRVWYAIKQYPVVETSFTNHDSVNWTGTVSDELKTADSILPPSGSLYCLKGTGAITRASLLATFADFDRFKLRWCPPAGTTSLSITLQTDASNKLVYTRTFAGGTGAGFNLSGGSGPDGVLTKSITLGSRRIVSVTGQMTAPCSVTVRTKLGTVTVWTSDPIAASGDNNIWTALIPENTYKNNLMDTLELEFTQLYYVANSYGVSCIKLDVSEYLQISQVTGTSARAVSRQVAHYSLHTSVVTIGGSSYLRFSKSFICAKPVVGINQQLNISMENCMMTVWMVGVNGEAFVFNLGAGAGIVEENGNLYATGSDILRGSNPGDIIDVNDYSGTVIVVVQETTYTSIVVWVTQTWAWNAVYNLFDEIDLPLSAFTKTGSPTTFISAILSATGANFYDGLCLYANQPTNRYVDAKSRAGTRKMPDRTGDGFGSENAARAFANGLLALVSTPAKDYAIEKPLDTDIELGDPVDCDGENLAVYAITYDFERGNMVVKVGKRVQETLEVLKNHAERIDRLENRR